jgi:hypothetical protein
VHLHRFSCGFWATIRKRNQPFKDETVNKAVAAVYGARCTPDGANRRRRPRNWTEKPIPDGLPGHGLAQHPMLFLGEGYNKLMIVNKGKIIWSYQTGGGWEYDDAWMLSNGNILFTRMQYIAEITPDKKVVWRYDAPEGTEITHASPSVKTRCCLS